MEEILLGKIREVILDSVDKQWGLKAIPETLADVRQEARLAGRLEALERVLDGVPGGEAGELLAIARGEITVETTA